MNTEAENTPPPIAPARAGLLSALRRPSVLAGIGLLILLGWQWLDTRDQLADMQQELAKRLATGDAATSENRVLVKQNQETLQTLAGKVGNIEAKLAEAQSQQLALENMYQELLRSRDERLLAEVEQAVSIAAQQLQFAGNVEAALIALQGADARLAAPGHAHLLPLRKLINRDIDRLKALPLADIPGISLKIEGVVGVVDVLPLAFEQRARAEPAVKSRLTAAPNGLWESLARDFWDELKQLIRIDRIDRNDPALLAPDHVFFLRENLKLRLINARLALLQRDGRTYREELRQARIWLERYFDMREKSVANAAATLKAVAGADLSLELPTLGETLGSIRNFKLAKK